MQVGVSTVSSLASTVMLLLGENENEATEESAQVVAVCFALITVAPSPHPVVAAVLIVSCTCSRRVSASRERENEVTEESPSLFQPPVTAIHRPSHRRRPAASPCDTLFSDTLPTVSLSCFHLTIVSSFSLSRVPLCFPAIQHAEEGENSPSTSHGRSHCITVVSCSVVALLCFCFFLSLGFFPSFPSSSSPSPTVFVSTSSSPLLRREEDEEKWS